MSRKLDNATCEEYINKFDDCKGATSSANIYIIVETAKANKLVVERYLVYLFDNLLKIDLCNSESLENLMPWSNKIPENMKIIDMK